MKTASPHPAPLVAARPAEDAEIPRNPATLLRKAHALGWTARATYAHGTSTDAYGQPSRLVESLVIRLIGASRALVGVWHNGSYASGYLLTRERGPQPLAWKAFASCVSPEAETTVPA